MISFYNMEVKRFSHDYGDLDRNAKEAKVDAFINADPTKISWTRALKGGSCKKADSLISIVVA
ncbi:MAG: hypothetical protein R3F47_19920 [Gammaproteobacteria bacterium]